jgi:lysozyme family protein
MIRALIIFALVLFACSGNPEHAERYLRNGVIMTTEETDKQVFDLCFEKTLRIEGGWVDDPNDAGGATKFGVSLSFLKKLADVDKNGYADGDINRDGVVDENDIKDLTLEDVHRIMKQYFWDVIPMNLFSGQIAIQWKLFDLAIHASPLQSVKVFQRAVGVEPDGVIGQKTLAAARSTPEDTLLIRFSYHQLRYYNMSVIHRPSNFKFLANWTWRADQQL